MTGSIEISVFPKFSRKIIFETTFDGIEKDFHS